MPLAFMLANVSSWTASQPLSNLPLHLSMYSFETWSGACVAPNDVYRKKGLSGVIVWRPWIQPMALSTMSSLK